ncbi:MAG TPA: tagaturonate epimerase family protein [Candidatus Marinimicrobia bacterium]|nr:tagaturonate epimerase family protein [Candidatus Neomarinimicrobiota bacterium]HRS51737.1 tagaturonate epimerase family protein [Candidatus Neomarinimicrobiota bacterium]HRU92113.1 tagaturonate epimerase family protein [Candidatus Neomarinimicrobiota bacterium]
MKLGKYSLGIGDRFGYQAEAQLTAIIKAAEKGVQITPVWNKSFREHNIIGSQPADVRRSAEKAVRALNWSQGYFVDADHISLKTVPHFIESSDFFTLDVADAIGAPASENDIQEFLKFAEKYTRPFEIPGIPQKIEVTSKSIENIARKYLAAVLSAADTYHYIQDNCQHDYVIELSVDETDTPQSPLELFFILALAAWQELPLATIAPKFSGRFNKGIDYVGDPVKFAVEFEQDVAVVKFAVGEFSLPEGLKLSVHSGSDKFSLYPHINRIITKTNAGLHLKTAGTTWLEELIGLATADGEGLEIAREIYSRAFEHYEELVKPYATVVDIDRTKLPAPSVVNSWTSREYVAALRHNQNEKAYNPHLRQLLHVGYKIAAEMGERYLAALNKYAEFIAPNVTENLYQRHIQPLFGIYG